MSFGPPTWVQCENRGVVMLTVRREGETVTLPACKTCWDECLRDKGHKVLKAVPIMTEEDAKCAKR